MACERAPRIGNVTDPDVRLLIGAYLTLAYAYEGAALNQPVDRPARRSERRVAAFRDECTGYR